MEYVSTFKNRLIYIFRINDPQHLGCVKIGEATAPDGFFNANCKELNDAAKKRINSYTQTAGIRYELLHTEMTLYPKGGQVKSFNDKQVHDVLLRSGVKKKSFEIDGKANEWFVCDLETAKNAIAAVKNGQSCLDAGQKSQDKSPVTFRPEQLRAIEQTKKVFKKGNKILWNAKMRMGKTLSSLEVVKQLKFHRTIIVTHRPVVDDGWFDDFGKIFYEDNTTWIYGSKNKGESSFSKLERSGKNYVYFASMQDLRGSQRVGGNFDKNEEIFDTDWDLLIIDEAHEGTQTELGKRVFDELVKENTKVINLSGTPFNLLETNEFNEENTFTWDYVMEQRAKQEWAISHPGDHNPYEELPKLNLLTFNLGQLADKYQDFDDKAFNFAEFFRTDDDGNFVHKKDIANFLDIISSDKSETLYPFSSTEYRDFFHHTFWIVPGVKEGKALAEMLRAHAVFGTYKIVNVCGAEDDETTGDPLDEVRNAIGQKPEDTYTITLSCGKLTTGVTVREWTAVLYLAGSKSTSPASYMQTIFRVQSPGYIGGKMKTDCYVFDFAPDRTLKMAAAAAKISAKAGEGDKEDRQILGDFLNFCPIIACDGTEMNPYNVDQMMQQLKRVYVDKVINTGFEDGHLYSQKLLKLNDIELEKFAELRDIIGKTKSSNKIPEIPINKQGFDEEEIERAQKDHKKKTGKDLSPEEARKLLEMQLKRKQRDAAVATLRGISIRMPLLLYGAKLENEEEDITLDRFVELVDDQSWAEFMPQGVTKDRFADFKQYYDEDIFSAAGHQIRQLAYAADKMPILQRIQRITEIFSAFRNPDKETVLTPWRVVNMHLSDTVGGWCFYDLANDTDAARGTDVPWRVSTDPHFIDRGLVSQRLFENANVKILEINSKSGLYPLYMAYSVFRHRLRVAQEAKRNLFKKITDEEEKQVWRNVLRENIFIICKTEMARSITQRTLCGFDPTMKVNTHVYDDLLNQITNKQSEFIKRLLNGNIFSQIKNNMKFDAIVGNPPYQLTGGSGGNNDAPIYQHFALIAMKLTQGYSSLIMPSRWFAAGRENLLGDFRKHMLTCGRIKKLITYADGSDLFTNVEIKGGICYYLDDAKYDGKCSYTLIRGGETQNVETDLAQFDILIREPQLIGIVQKVTAKIKKDNIKTVDSIMSADTPFGIPSNPRDSSKTPFKVYETSSNEHNVLLYHIENQKRKIEYAALSDIKKNASDIDKYKVFITIAGGSGNDEKVLSIPEYAPSHSVCSQSYIYAAFKTEVEAKNYRIYVMSRFFRVLVSAIKITQSAPSRVYRFVPLQDFTAKSDIDWTKSVAEIDRQLYAKYNLTDEEIAFIEQMIKPMK